MNTNRIIALVTWFIVLVTLAIALNHIRFSLWTNVLFVWPAARATSVGAWNEASVFSVTAIVSTLHHGCSDEWRYILATEVWVVILIIVGCVVVASFASVAIKYRFGVTELFLATALIVSLPLLTVVLSSLDDACVGASPILWATADFITAFASLAIIIIYLSAVPRHLELAIFWIFATIVLVGTLYRNDHFIDSMTPVYACLLIVASIAVIARLIHCTNERIHVDYDAVDVIVSTLVGVASLALFLGYNTSSTHGWWHAGASLALYLGIEAVHRRRRVQNPTEL